MKKSLAGLIVICESTEGDFNSDWIYDWQSTCEIFFKVDNYSESDLASTRLFGG